MSSPRFDEKKEVALASLRKRSGPNISPSKLAQLSEEKNPNKRVPPNNNFCSKLNSLAHEGRWTEEFVDVPYLEGNPLLGRASDLLTSKDGKDMGRLIREGIATAQKNNTTNCYWHFGFSKAVLVLDPKDLEYLFKNYTKHFYTANAGSFEVAFDQNILSLESHSAEYKTEIRRFRQLLRHQLHLEIPVMQAVAKKHLAKIEKNQGVLNDLEDFSALLTLDMICHKLGLPTHNVKDDAKRKILSLIHDATVELAKGKKQLFRKVVPSFLQPIFCCSFTFDKILNEIHELLREKFLEPNVEQLLNAKSWINPTGKLTPKELFSKPTYNDIGLPFVAGQDTSKNLLVYSKMLLGSPNHQEIKQKVLDEIAMISAGMQQQADEKREFTPADWGKEQFDAAVYLEAVALETLRLHPGFPGRLIQVKDNIPFKGGVLKNGDMVVLSTKETQRLKHVWGDNAEEFDPSRFLETDINGKLKIKSLAPMQFQFFPFGFIVTGRPCVGSLYALQEMKVVIANTLHRYPHMQLAHLQHPFKDDQVFALEVGHKNIQMNFEPEVRLENIATPAEELPSLAYRRP